MNAVLHVLIPPEVQVDCLIAIERPTQGGKCRMLYSREILGEEEITQTRLTTAGILPEYCN